MISIQRVSRGKEPEKATEVKEQSSKPKTPKRTEFQLCMHTGQTA